MARHSYSLSRQLYLRLTVVVTAAFAFFITVLLFDFSVEAERIEGASLLGLAERIKERPELFVFDGNPLPDRIAVDGITVRRASGQHVIVPTRWAIDSIPAEDLTYDDHDMDIGQDSRTGETLVAVAVQVDGAYFGFPSETLTLQVARPANDFNPIIRTFFRATFTDMWWIFALILIVTLVVVRLTISRSMQAVNIASDQAASIAPGDISRRLPLQGLPQEVQTLALKVNQALDRLEQGYMAERSFTSSAAHELRTPLAVLRTKVEAVPKGQQRDSALAQVDKMARLVGQLLQLARVETWQTSTEDTLDAGPVCRQVAAELSPQIIAEGGDIELLAMDGDCGWPVDRVLFEIVLRNLIENAMRHGGQPAHIRIMLTRTHLTVEDNGRGISQAHRSDVFKVFWRGRSGNTDGAGVGLALVARIAEHMSCRVDIDRSELGGAAVTFSRLGLSSSPTDKASQDVEPYSAGRTQTEEVAFHQQPSRVAE